MGLYHFLARQQKKGKKVSSLLFRRSHCKALPSIGRQLTQLKCVGRGRADFRIFGFLLDKNPPNECNKSWSKGAFTLWTSMNEFLCRPLWFFSILSAVRTHLSHHGALLFYFNIFLFPAPDSGSVMKYIAGLPFYISSVSSKGRGMKTVHIRQAGNPALLMPPFHEYNPSSIERTPKVYRSISRRRPRAWNGKQTPSRSISEHW
jgi:hypothetical protein